MSQRLGSASYDFNNFARAIPPFKGEIPNKILTLKILHS
jgi:hypothetical protein